jgi:hypothetical protein
MGLDMYAYSAAKAGAQQDYWDGYDWDEKKSHCPEPKSLAYWRKHPSLHGWMEHLYRARGGEGSFNGVELELTWPDIDQLEQDIMAGQLPETQGFFFGDASDTYYLTTDLEFVKQAKADLFLGLRVFYNSSW